MPRSSACTSSPSKTRGRATSDPRSKNTGRACSPYSRRSTSTRPDPDGDLIVGEVDVFVGRNYVLSVRRKTLQGFLNVRARAEAEPENLARGWASSCTPSWTRSSTATSLSLARLEDDLEGSRTRSSAVPPCEEHRGLLRAQAPPDGPQARGGLTPWTRPRNCRWTGAVGVPRRPGVLPRRLRSPPAHQRRDRQSTRDAADRHLRDLALVNIAKPGHQAAGRVRRPHHRSPTLSPASTA